MIIGIDPGYDRIGWAVGQKTNNTWQNIHYGCIQTNKKDSLHDRYLQIIKELTEIINKFHPKEAAVETLFFSKNTKTAMKVSEARGIILSNFLQNNINIFEYNPNQIKLTVTGYGKADKKAVEKMVRMELNLNNNGKIIDDAIDALGIMITHEASSKINRYLC